MDLNFKSVQRPGLIRILLIWSDALTDDNRGYQEPANIVSQLILLIPKRVSWGRIVAVAPADIRTSSGCIHRKDQIVAGDVAKVVVTALLISFTVTLYPAWRASRIQPADALRYE